MSVTKPVFTDDTGRRATVLLWLGRVVVTVSVIVGGAIAFTLTTHIALPGLDGLVSPTLNGSQPELAIPATPDPGDGLDATDSATPTSRLTATPRAKSRPSTSLRTTSAVTRRAGSTTTTRRSTSAPTSPARSTAKPRNSHAASPTTAGRRGGKTTKPTPPGQTRKPVR